MYQAVFWAWNQCMTQNYSFLIKVATFQTTNSYLSSSYKILILYLSCMWTGKLRKWPTPPPNYFNSWKLLCSPKGLQYPWVRRQGCDNKCDYLSSWTISGSVSLHGTQLLALVGNQMLPNSVSSLILCPQQLPPVLLEEVPFDLPPFLSELSYTLHTNSENLVGSCQGF